jgi:hypothetical protein
MSASDCLIPNLIHHPTDLVAIGRESVSVVLGLEVGLDGLPRRQVRLVPAQLPRQLTHHLSDKHTEIPLDSVDLKRE